MKTLERILTALVLLFSAPLILYPAVDYVRMEIETRRAREIFVYPSPTPCPAPWDCGPLGWWDNGARHRDGYIAPPPMVLESICSSARRAGLKTMWVKCWNSIHCFVAAQQGCYEAHWTGENWQFLASKYPLCTSRGELCSWRLLHR